MLTYFPTLALTNTIAMKNMTNPEKEFPGIRVLGTIGWIAAGFAVTFGGFETNVGMFGPSAGAAALLGLFSFALPDTPPVKDEKASIGQMLGLDDVAIEGSILFGFHHLLHADLYAFSVLLSDSKSCRRACRVTHWYNHVLRSDF